MQRWCKLSGLQHDLITLEVPEMASQSENILTAHHKNNVGVLSLWIMIGSNYLLLGNYMSRSTTSPYPHHMAKGLDDALEVNGPSLKDSRQNQPGPLPMPLWIAAQQPFVFNEERLRPGTPRTPARLPARPLGLFPLGQHTAGQRPIHFKPDNKGALEKTAVWSNVCLS